LIISVTDGRFLFRSTFAIREGESLWAKRRTKRRKMDCHWPPYFMFARSENPVHSEERE
jgi:hypothetical protein